MGAPTEQPGAIVDLFAGPGGWSEGLRMLGLSDIGIEWDRDACLTRRAAGHLTVRADVAQYPPEAFAGAWGLIASPPCQDFSVAGRGAGRGGERGRLVDSVPGWVRAVRPAWVACEQVPPVLPIWREHAHGYRELGYSTWTGILNAADFGVPQSRRRAVLLASLNGPALPPTPTHAADPVVGMFGTPDPWMTMASALGWGLTDRPGFTFCGGNTGGPDAAGGSGARRLMSLAIESGRWAWERPATTIVGSFRPDIVSAPGYRHAGDGSRQDAPGSFAISIEDALVLQSFDRGYPVQGSKTKQAEQVGNAVPPLLAAHILSATTGYPILANERVEAVS